MSNNPEFDEMLYFVRGQIMVQKTKIEIAGDEGNEFPGLKRELAILERLDKTLTAIEPRQDSFRAWLIKSLSSGK